ncbi:MAG: nucleotidyl transferase AbiEii/AbiGii toxin family protein [Pseudomonadota bacterium]
MFERNHHQKVANVLSFVRSGFFIDVGAYFGGGTLLTLSYKEYRQSEDVDFICPVGEGYRKLRAEIFDKGYDALFQDFSKITLPREITADQYGVRFPVRVGNIQIKFEIIVEARIKLGKKRPTGISVFPHCRFGTGTEQACLTA